MNRDGVETEIESALIALGTNMPFGALSGEALMVAALDQLQLHGIVILTRSSVWQSPAWPSGSDQPDYLNAVVKVDPMGRSPTALMTVLHATEAKLGRVRGVRWEARTLDLDLIAFGDQCRDPSGTDGFELPHPRAHERAFVLGPLLEVEPNWIHPRLGITGQKLWAGVQHQPILKLMHED